MRHSPVHRLLLVVIAIVGASMLDAAANAQLSLSWYTIDGGGATSSNGALSISSTAGQPDASNPMTNGSLSITGGFWPGATPSLDCPADIIIDNTVGVADLLAVISAWGACPGPCPPRCAPDISPIPSGDCAVGVADLLLVISSWGPCP